MRPLPANEATQTSSTATQSATRAGVSHHTRPPVSLRHWTWHPCSAKNLQEIVGGHEGGVNDHAGLGSRAALHIIASDFNDRLDDGDGHYRCWYRMMNRDVPAGRCADTRDLGFTDPLYEDCRGDARCVMNRSRIDYIFSRRSDGRPVRTERFDVVSWGEAHEASVAAGGTDRPSNTVRRQGFADVGDRYSGHRARSAWLYYE
ncbi:MAG: hypothetical protein FJ137_16890 [Deltaproteobacteria bacterium]|nr:hypothetical protein [Deltaproteobacteria bacterium]